jgi:hypothetical protein
LLGLFIEELREALWVGADASILRRSGRSSYCGSIVTPSAATQVATWEAPKETEIEPPLSAAGEEEDVAQPMAPALVSEADAPLKIGVGGECCRAASGAHELTLIFIRVWSSYE